MIEYRAADRSAGDAVVLLHTRSWRESDRGSFSDAFLDGELPEERILVWRGRLADPPANQFVQIDFDAEDLVGFVCAYRAVDPRWGSFIDDLHVAGDAKRSGIGASLMRQAGAWLDGRYPDERVLPLRARGQHAGKTLLRATRWPQRRRVDDGDPRRRRLPELSLRLGARRSRTPEHPDV